MSIKYKTVDEQEWTDQFSNNLQHVIAKKKIQKKELAKQLGITNAMLSRYIHGAATPSVYKACQIANALGCDINDLICNND